MNQQEYLVMTVERFEEGTRGWFYPKNLTKVISKDINEINAKLESILPIGQYSILEFEDGSGFDHFSNVWQSRDRLMMGQEKFDQLEEKYREYFEFSPKWLLGFYNSVMPFRNFIAINSENVKIESSSKKKNCGQYAMDLGSGMLLIYPKGSDYNLDSNSKKELIDRLKNLKI